MLKYLYFLLYVLEGSGYEAMEKFKKVTLSEGRVTGSDWLSRYVGVTSLPLCSMVTIQTPWSKVFCFSEGGSCLFSSLLATKNDTEESDLLDCYLISNRIPPRPELVKASTKFFVSEKLNYVKARDYCLSHDGKPFIPMTQEEHDYYTNEVMSRSPTTGFNWYPVNDMETEGDVRYYDGTEYGAQGMFTPKPNPNYLNTEANDCAGVNNDGLVGWGDCFGYYFLMLCVHN